MKLHYQSLGQGQPLILLHGLFGSADNWGAIARYFAQYYQVIALICEIMAGHLTMHRKAMQTWWKT